jgi:hypothetical protein
MCADLQAMFTWHGGAWDDYADNPEGGYYYRRYTADENGTRNWVITYRDLFHGGEYAQERAAWASAGYKYKDVGADAALSLPSSDNIDAACPPCSTRMTAPGKLTFKMGYVPGTGSRNGTPSFIPWVKFVILAP